MVSEPAGRPEQGSGSVEDVEERAGFGREP